MKNVIKTIGILLISLSVATMCAAKPFTANNPLGVDKLFIFGDSLSDEGVQNNNPNVVNPKQPTWTVSSGQVWPTQLAALMGIAAPTANNSDFPAGQAHINYTTPLTGTDYAAGGATTNGPGYKATTEYSPPSLLSQVGYFTEHNSGNVDKNGLYVVWAGANDLFVEINAIIAQMLQGNIPTQAELQAELTNTVNAITANEKSAVTELHNAGAEHIVVVDIPDLLTTPEFQTILSLLQSKPQLQGELIQVLEGLSQNIRQNINVQFGQQSLGFKVYAVDVIENMDAMFEQVVQQKGTYTYTGQGTTVTVTNASTPICSGDALICSSTQTPGYFFADGVHPSNEGHTMLAHMILTRLLAG